MVRGARGLRVGGGAFFFLPLSLYLLLSLFFLLSFILSSILYSFISITLIDIVYNVLFCVTGRITREEVNSWYSTYSIILSTSQQKICYFVLFFIFFSRERLCRRPSRRVAARAMEPGPISLPLPAAEPRSGFSGAALQLPPSRK